MHRYLYSIALLVLHLPAISCISCNKTIQEGIYNSQFYPNLLTMLSAFIVLGVMIAVLCYFSLRRVSLTGQRRHPLLAIMAPLGTASVVLGIGVGGFIDGIVLHQLLQWHEMLSSKIPSTTYEGKSINMFWDGIFHAFTLLVMLTGVILLWRLLRKKDTINTSGYLISGGMLCGWALFNLTEGVIDHHLLRLHNVREASTNVDSWNYGFMMISMLMLFFSLLLMRLSVRKKTFHFIIRIR